MRHARQSLHLMLLQARICYAKRAYGEALQLYQRILRLSPYSRPDPRIGIGLCQWQLGNKDRAKAAWERSLQLVRAANSYFLFLTRKFRTGINGPLSCCWELKHSMQVRIQRPQNTSAVPVSRPASSTSSERSMQTRKMRPLQIALLNFSSEGAMRGRR